MGKLPYQTYQDEVVEKINSEYVRNKLKLRQIKEKTNFKNRFPEAHKFLRDRGIDLSNIRDYSAKMISAGAIAGALLLSSPSSAKYLPTLSEINVTAKNSGFTSVDPLQKKLLDSIGKVLPAKPRPLTPGEEKTLEGVFSQYIGVNSKANLEGEHLNTTYGLIGAEQHLRRYPGDTVGNHGTGTILNEGMAPGLGAWGYFAYSKNQLTPDLTEKEKWYAVVQTLYLKDWNTRQPYLTKWYKYRKVLIVNTVNGNAVVADVADSGPAMFTGKVFGGSPEVMDYLGGPRYKKGPVVLFFVDDPENKVPLGPVNYNNINMSGVNLKEI